jgi:hypothetical protein
MLFHKGQTVRWPFAPRELAQVVEIRRTCVRLYYVTKKHGLARQPIVHAARLAELQRVKEPPLPIHNLFGRAGMDRRPRPMIAANPGGWTGAI